MILEKLFFRIIYTILVDVVIQSVVYCEKAWAALLDQQKAASELRTCVSTCCSFSAVSINKRVRRKQTFRKRHWSAIDQCTFNLIYDPFDPI